jgi:AbrB family looped-hinge helix DNA binding protein
MDMKTIVTRNGQITLSKEYRNKLGIREGTPVYERMVGNMIIIEKANPEFWDTYRGGSLPDKFDEILKEIRARGEVKSRLKELGVI